MWGLGKPALSLLWGTFHLARTWCNVSRACWHRDRHGAVLLTWEQRFPSPSTKTLCKEEKLGEKTVAHIYRHSEAANLVTASSPAPGGTMRTWQDIFAEKIADVHLKEPWMLQEDDTLQVHVLEPGWKEFVQRRALGR